MPNNEQNYRFQSLTESLNQEATYASPDEPSRESNLRSGTLLSGLSAKKFSTKSKEFSNPYMKNIKSEYSSLLEDISEYKLDINQELLNKISSDIESIDKQNEQVKKIFTELTQKENSVISELDIIKSSIKQKVDELKFQSLLVKFDEYFEQKNWSNVEKCYTNATYIAFTDDMFKELEKRSAKMIVMKDELELSNLMELINKFLSNQSSTTLNHIYKKFVTINLTKLNDDNKSAIKDFLKNLNTTNKSKALTFIFENKSYNKTSNLNIL